MDKKIAYELKTTGQILMQFYRVCILFRSISRVKQAYLTFDVKS